MGTYCVSDVHGRFEELKEILSLAGFGNDDRLFILGDSIDRGPDSVGVLRFILNSPNVSCLLGNHELMMVDAVGNNSEHMLVRMDSAWTSYNGGWETREKMLAEMSEKERSDMLEYFAFEAPVHVELEISGRNFILVHAGVDVGDDGKVDFSAQDKYDMVWTRATYILGREPSDAVIVSGHSDTGSVAGFLHKAETELDGFRLNQIAKFPIEEYRIIGWNGRIDIDCGAGSGHRLGLLRLDDLATWYVECRE